MAYSATVTKTKINNVDYVFDITEDYDGTSAGSTTDFSLDVPVTGRILRYKAKATNASHKVTPIICVVENATNGVNIVMEISSAANEIDEQAVDPPKYYASGKKLYINNNCDNSAGVVTTRIFLRDTWGL